MKKLAFMAAVAALTFTSCGGGETKTQEPAKEQKQVIVEDEPEVVELQNVEVTIEGNDQMKFNKEMIEVPANSMVKLTLTHTGTMPKEAMGHNWVLLKAGVDKAEFAAEAVTAKDEDHVPAALKSKVLAYTALVGGGESITIEFEAPAAGEYEYICSFPGHYGMMNGKFIVK